MKTENMGKADSKRTAIIAAVLIIVVAIIVVVWNKGFGEKSSEELDGKYQMVIASGDNSSTVFEMVFDAEQMTYQENISVGDISQTITEGVYEVNGDEVTVTSQQVDTEGTHFTQRYLMSGKYLIVADYLYEGEIPDGDTFDAECSYTTSENTTNTITFKKDGTYVEDNTGETTQGTYQRKGDIISRTDDSGSDKINFLVYNGGITNSYYIAE